MIRRFLAWLFRKLGHDKADSILYDVLGAALDWDIPPSDISNMVSDIIDKDWQATHGKTDKGLLH